MVHDPRPHPLESRQNRYLLSGLLVVIGLSTTGLLQVTLLAGAVLLFGVTYRVDEQLLVVYLFERVHAAVSPVARQGLILCLELLIPGFEKVVTYLRTAHATRVRAQRADDLIDQFFSLARDDLLMTVPPLDGETRDALRTDSIEGDDGLTSETTFEPIAEVVFDGSAQVEIEARLITILTLRADCVDRATDRHDVVTLIDRLIGGASFYPVNERADAILTCYEACRLASWRETPTQSVFECERTRSDRVLVQKFLREYSDEQRFKHILKNNRQIEELRSTLADLIRSGKLDIGNLHEDVIRDKLDTVTRELREQDARYSTYMILSVQLINESDPYGAKAALEAKFPTVKLGTWDVQHGSEFTEALLSTRLVYTSQEYASSDAFLNQEIKPLLPPESEYNDGAFVAVMPFEAPGTCRIHRKRPFSNGRPQTTGQPVLRRTSSTSSRCKSGRLGWRQKS
jgi:hypothetical protein